jgi:hypothetical protein
MSPPECLCMHRTTHDRKSRTTVHVLSGIRICSTRVRAEAPRLRSVRSVRELLWTEWHWDRFFFKSFSFSLWVSLIRCSLFTHIYIHIIWGTDEGPAGDQFHGDILCRLLDSNGNNNTVCIWSLPVATLWGISCSVFFLFFFFCCFLFV